MIHMASVWVPFTSESKEAIADYDEIRKEMKLALMECGRKLGTYLRKRQKMQREAARRDVFERYIGEISKAVNAINGTDAKKLYDALLKQAKKRTAQADQILDEEGKVVKENPEDLEGVIIVDDGAAPVVGAGPAVSAPERPASKNTKEKKVRSKPVAKAGESQPRRAPEEARAGPRTGQGRDARAREEAQAQDAAGERQARAG